MSIPPFGRHDGAGSDLAQIGRMPLFTHDGEIETAKRIELGDTLAQEGGEGTP